MKINKKLIVSSLASAMGLSIVGAITGTVAWYQYSTRSTLAMIGVSAKTAANLKIKINDANYTMDYKSDLLVADINAYLADSNVNKNNKLSPVTSGAQEKNAALNGLKAHPVYKVFDDANWGAADEEAYLVLPLKLKWEGVNEGEEVAAGTGRNKKVWVNNALFQADASTVATKGDLSKAIRVHLATSSAKMLLSKEGADTATTGLLDLNRDGVMDDENITWKDFDTDPSYTGTPYGTADSKQTAYKVADVKPTVDGSGNPSAGTVLGTCDNNGELEVTVTIWLEGWQKLDNIEAVVPENGDDVSALYTDASCTEAATGTADGTTTYYKKSAASADWNEDTYINSFFDLGLEFITERL